MLLTLWSCWLLILLDKFWLLFCLRCFYWFYRTSILIHLSKNILVCIVVFSKYSRQTLNFCLQTNSSYEKPIVYIKTEASSSLLATCQLYEASALVRAILADAKPSFGVRLLQEFRLARSGEIFHWPGFLVRRIGCLSFEVYRPSGWHL